MRNGRRFAGLLFASVFLAVMTGCGAPFFISDQELAVILGKEYLYAGGATGVDAFDVDVRTGRITKLAGSPFGAGCIGMLTAAPSGSFLYALPFLSNNVYGFQIQGDGTLATLPGIGPFIPTLTSPIAMAIDPKERYAHIIHSGSAQAITSYGFDAGTGALSFLGATLGVGCAPYDAVVDPGGRFLYLGIGLPTFITRYGVDAGLPSGPLGSVNSAAAAIRLALDASGPYVYGILGATSDQNIVGYRIDSTGMLTPVSGSPFRLGFGATNLSATGLAVDDWGAFLYAAGSDDMLYRYRIDGDTGSLSLAQGLGTANGAKLAVSHSGRYVFAAGDDNSGVGTIRVYGVGSDGTLSEISGSPFTLGGGPVRDVKTINSHRLP